MATAGLHDSELGELQRRLIILRVGLLLVVALLGLRLWHLQIREGPYYRDLSENNRTRSVIMEPARGLIYDRNGVLLANNVPSFTLYVSLEDVKDRDLLIDQLTNLLGLDPALVRKKLTARGSKQLPRKVKDRLTLREATLIESHRLDLPGVKWSWILCVNLLKRNLNRGAGRGRKVASGQYRHPNILSRYG